MRPEPAGPASPEPPVLILAGGKGGVGVSALSVVLAGASARRHPDAHVLLVDGSQNLGNLHVLLGKRPARGLRGVLDGIRDPQSLIQQVSRNIWLLAAESGAESMHNLAPADRVRLDERLARTFPAYDLVLIDASGGMDSALRMSALLPAWLVVVAAPEPTALTSAFALMKIASLERPDLPIDVLVNRAATEPEALRAYQKLLIASRRLLRREPRLLGAVPEDAGLRAAALDPGRLLESVAGPAANALSDIADRWLEPRSPAGCITPPHAVAGT